MTHHRCYCYQFDSPLGIFWKKKSSKSLSMVLKICGGTKNSIKVVKVRAWVKNMSNGESQNWFRDLPKFSNIGKILGSSCSASKIVPSYEIWVHGLVPEAKNRIRHFLNMDWDKYSLKSKFSKTNGTIVISVQRSSGFCIFMQK